MAQYKALAQNTYKFVHEMTLNNNGEIDIPTVCNLPRIKYLSLDRATVAYRNLVPANSTSSTSEATYCDVKYAYSSGVTSTEAAAGNVLNYSYIKPHITAVGTTPVVIDGKVYYGQKSAYYTKLTYVLSTKSTTGYGKIAGFYYPPAKIKVVKYEAASGAITASESTLSAYEGTEYQTYGASSSAYYGAARATGIVVPKAANDIIMGIEISYPKYDITLSGTGLQYSLDDGLTFTDVTEGLAFSQVEHVVFKNTGEATRSIGTTAGGADIATIAGGATYVCVPSADGAWYIS